MCFFSSPAPVVVQQPPVPTTPTPEPPPPAPAPSASAAAAGASKNPVMSNVYDPTNPESGVNEEKGAARKRADGTQQLRIDLDPNAAQIGKDHASGLQIAK
jgi:hypothetical protein